MQVSNMRQEHQNNPNRPTHPSATICVLGFGPMLEEKLTQLFQQPSLSKHSYRLVPSSESTIDLLLVNYDNPLALQKKDLLLNGLSAKAHVIAVSQKPLDNPPPYHIQGMLTAGRLMAMLAKIPAPETVNLTIQPAQSATVLAHPAIVPTPAPNASIMAMAETGLARYRALVVDDSLAIQKSLELKLLGLEQIASVDFAENGVSALALAEANHYDLIFLDVMMPGMDGYETCGLLRANPRYKKTPIIMVSGKTSPLDEVKGVMSGCTTYLTKPVQDEAFRKLSTRVLAWLSARNGTETISKLRH